MDKRSAADEAAVRYLLGEMSEDEKSTLERGVVGEEDAFEQVAAAEDELIDDYLSGALTAEERDRFEKVYLGSAERRERVEFAQALHRRLSEKSRTTPLVPFSARGAARPFPTLLAAAAVLFAAIGAYFAWTSIQLREELRRVEADKGSVSRRDEELSRQLTEVQGRAERLQGEMARLSEQLANLQSQATRSVAFALTAGLLRDGGNLQALRIPAGIETARLTLPLSDPSYVSYRAVIQTPEGKTVWKGDAVPAVPGARSLLVTVPARALASGDYILSVTGVTASGRSETAADFSFRVKAH